MSELVPVERIVGEIYLILEKEVFRHSQPVVAERSAMGVGSAQGIRPTCQGFSGNFVHFIQSKFKKFYAVFHIVSREAVFHQAKVMPGFPEYFLGIS